MNGICSAEFDLFMKDIEGNSQVNEKSLMLGGSMNTAETSPKSPFPPLLTSCPLPNSFYFRVLLPGSKLSEREAGF